MAVAGPRRRRRRHGGRPRPARHGPRRGDPAGGARNDAIAPEPGFTRAQYRRLAEAYVAASLRAGMWLVPAYHATLDNGLPDGHDDPQNFDLPAWDAELAAVLSQLEG